jgi:hypothetical protein
VGLLLQICYSCAIPHAVNPTSSAQSVMGATLSFSCCLSSKSWFSPLKMIYAIPHFMGYRFGLFNYATEHPGGYADFDWFRIKYKDQ